MKRIIAICVCNWGERDNMMLIICQSLSSHIRYTMLRYNFSSEMHSQVPLHTNNNTTPLAPLIKLNISLKSGSDVIIQCIIAKPISY